MSVRIQGEDHEFTLKDSKGGWNQKRDPFPFSHWKEHFNQNNHVQSKKEKKSFWRKKRREKRGNQVPNEHVSSRGEGEGGRKRPARERRGEGGSRSPGGGGEKVVQDRKRLPLNEKNRETTPQWKKGAGEGVP